MILPELHQIWCDPSAYLARELATGLVLSFQNSRRMTPFQSQTEKISQRLVTALSKLPGDSSPKYVHRLRTAVRRIESLVSYAQPDLGRKQRKTLDRLKGFNKRAGRIRDIDVQMELLKHIANGSTAGDRHALAELLLERRDRQVHRLVASASKVVDVKFFAQARKITEKLIAAPGPANLASPLAIASGRLNEVETEFKANTYTPGQLHEVRLHIKKIRYVAELAEDGPERQLFVDRLQAAQDALGAWHDWELLSRTARKKFKSRISCPLVVEVRALLAARQAAATMAVHHLFADPREVQSSARKQVQPVPAQALARHAG
jgi:CHAD domain-containing protein